MDAPESSRPIRRLAPRSAKVMTVVGAGVMIVMLLACLVTLPYTIGSDRADDTAGIAQRRFEASHPDEDLLPPFWARHTEVEAERRDAGTKRFVFGSDLLGRDVFLRCLAGGGISLGIGLASATLALIIGTSYGTIAGFCGGRVDSIMMRILDILFGLPNILLVVLLSVAVDGILRRGASMPSARMMELVNVLTLLVAIGGVTWLTMARVVRGQVLSLKAQPFMEACRAMGVPLRRQIWRHLLPNLVGPIIVYGTLLVPSAILSESFLSFLGIGVREPLPSWGNLAAAGLSEINTVRSRWWLLLWPCLFIGTSLIALNFIGEGLREMLDPKRRAGRV